MAADAAAAKVSELRHIDLSVDADTEGIAGTPPISQTILRKIEESDLFLADMTFVAETKSGKKVPNANVMGEYGYALRCKGLDRILLVMNVAFGPPEELPFDLRHLRHPARYSLDEGAPDGQRRSARNAFAQALERNFLVAIDHLLSVPAAAAPDPLWDDAQAALAELSNSRNAGTSPVLVSSPRLVVHVIPLAALKQPFLQVIVVKASRPHFPPSADVRVNEGLDENQWWSNDPPRRVDGKPNLEAGWLFRLIRPGFFESIVNIGRRIDDDPDIAVHGKDIEAHLVNAVDRSARVAQQVGLQGPALVAAGLEGIEDVKILRERPGQGGRRIRKSFAVLGTVRLDALAAPAADQLRPLMERIWLIGGWYDGSPSFSDNHWIGY